MLMATAAATFTEDEPLEPPFLSAVLASGVAPAAVLLRAPLPAAVLSPRPRCAPFCWSTLPSCVPSSLLPPLALALALPLEVCLDCDVTDSAPPSVTERSSRARVVSTTEPKDKAMPSARSLPCAAPSACVVAVPVWSAAMLRLCKVKAVALLRTSARVSRLATVMAAAGVMAVPPEEPPCTWVLMVLFDVADKLTAEVAPVKRALVSMMARAVASTTLTDTEAPTPTLLPAVTLASALAVSAVVELALSDRLVVPCNLMLAVLVTRASALVTPTLTAKEPATPTPVLPAPEVACAPVRLVFRVACAVTPLVALKVALPESKVLLATLMLLMATATPTPVPPAGGLLLSTTVLRPSATVLKPPADPATVAVELSTLAAALLKVPLVDTSTTLSPVTVVTATAAANCTEPSLVWAFCCCKAVWPCVGAPPALLAPPLVDLACVSTMRVALDSTDRLPPDKLALSATSALVSPEMMATATLPPAALPALEPAPPSACVVAFTVLRATTDKAPVALKLDEPPNRTLDALLMMDVATAASLLVALDVLSGAVASWLLTVEAASSARVPVAVMLLAALSTMLAEVVD